MKSLLLLAALILSVLQALSQQTISGKVTDQKSSPLAGANVFIDGTYDGATTNEQGAFQFQTDEKGIHTLVVSLLGYDSVKIEIDVSKSRDLSVVLGENVNTLDAVVISAGTLEAGDKARVSVLKPLDIVTTAGSAGDIIAALQTLPGTQTVGESGRLFVRGGEADETQTFVDGIRVAQPYGASTANLPTRGRFSPFLFSGMSFSTGGYSAEYGDALSSVLLLNTQDEPDQDKTDISLMSVGLGLGHTKKWEQGSISFNAAYIDLFPYQLIAPQDADWNKPFRSLSGETVVRHKVKDGLFKAYVAFESSQFDINQKIPGSDFSNRINLHNDNFYLNTSLRKKLSDNLELFTGVSYGLGTTDTDINLDNVSDSERAAHLKLKLKHRFSTRFRIAVGADYFLTDFNQDYTPHGSDALNTGFYSNIAAIYSEADWFLNKKIAFKAGLRYANNSLFNSSAVSPRIALAVKVSAKAQISAAYGEFAQAPKADYLKFSRFADFTNEKASHYILNYQFSKDRQTFRAEAYRKQYRDLVTFTDQSSPEGFANGGDGFANGLDLFWRDGNNIKNLEYWISYSLIDTKRKYRDFPTSVAPGFAAAHTLSVVAKLWVNEWRSQISLTNSFASGRSYNDPNRSEFMAGKTKGYNNLSLGWAYLLSAQKILYFSVSNVLGNQNVFGYDYAASPNDDGVFQREAIRPTADRFFFVGFFWTISKDKKSNQLDNL